MGNGDGAAVIKSILKLSYRDWGLRPGVREVSPARSRIRPAANDFICFLSGSSDSRWVGITHRPLPTKGAL